MFRHEEAPPSTTNQRSVGSYEKPIKPEDHDNYNGTGLMPVEKRTSDEEIKNMRKINRRCREKVTWFKCLRLEWKRPIKGNS